MRRSSALLILSLLSTLFLCSSTSHALSTKLYVQGRLTTSTGAYLPAGTYSATFNIYNSETATTVLWSDTFPTVDVGSSGTFQVTLGSQKSLSGVLYADKPTPPYRVSVFGSNTKWLEVVVDGEVFGSRVKINPSSYASNADTLDGNDWTFFSPSTHTHTFSNITGVLADTQIPATITRDSELTAKLALKAPLSHSHTFSNITGVLTDTQIPAAITRDSELTAKLAAKAPLSHTHTFSNITGVLADTQIPAGGITNAKLANLSVTAAKVSPAGSASGQVLTSTGTGVAWRPPFAGPQGPKGDTGPTGPPGPLNPNVIATDLNTAIGIGALTPNTTGGGNTASGRRALSSNTAGAGNTASGEGALFKNTTGVGNTANGFYALASNTTADANTAIGGGALSSNTTGVGNTASGASALGHNTTGGWNTASGHSALVSNTTGSDNTASGGGALASNTTGGGNTASGEWALHENTTGSHNTASGAFALDSNTTGSRNTAFGHGALNSTIGNANIALGYLAGYWDGEFTGGNNIYVGGRPSAADENNTIRIGDSKHGRAFITGVYNNNVSTGATVYVNSNGQLGTVTSSSRYKEEIENMGEASSGLMRLRPVTFRYKPEYSGGSRSLQYGLIAEEVAAVYPDLVQYDPKTGLPHTVSYHLVNAMLLNEVQKQHRHIMEQDKEISALKDQNKELAALKERLSRLEARLSETATRAEPELLDHGQLSRLEAQTNR
ncbi:MAG: tail fiber domain-containing protein [Syntrophobacteraceae bacterium]